MKFYKMFIVILVVGFVGILNVSASCRDNKTEPLCLADPDYACVWNETDGVSYCNTDKLTYVSCGDIFDIPSYVPSVVSMVVNILKIATPIILIVISMITLVKAMVSSDENEIKKAQNSLVKKIIAAVIIFLTISIVQFVMAKVAENSTEKENISECLSCFLNNDCDNKYFKTNIAGKYYCTYLDNIDDFSPCN